MTTDFLRELTPKQYPTIDFIKGLCDTEAIPAYSKEVQERRKTIYELNRIFAETLTESQKKMYDSLEEYSSALDYDEENERFVAGFKLATRLLIEELK